MDKLTLSVDKEIIKNAKQIAVARGTSVSAIFSQFVRSLNTDSNSTKIANQPLAPITKKAIGIVSLPSNKSDRQLIEEALSERYIK